MEVDQLQKGAEKDYCRLCLIKFERRFMIPIFSAERLELQIRSVLRTVEVSKVATRSSTSLSDH